MRPELGGRSRRRLIESNLRHVIELRYGLGERADPLTLEEVGRQLGVTRERVRQIEAHAIETLRNAEASICLRDLLMFP